MKKNEDVKENKKNKETKEKEEIIGIFNIYTENIKVYNKFMNDLFSKISKDNFFFTKKKKKDLLKNMKENVNYLVDFIYNLDEKNNKDIYNCLSTIYGAFLGDAIGAYCEFKRPNLNNMKLIFVGNPLFGNDPGQVTDDSEMAIASAFALMDNPEKENINSDYLYYYYGLWHISKPKDEGITTRKALNIFDIAKFNPMDNNNYEKEFKIIEKNNNNSLANGFLMRTSPFIVWCYFRYNQKIVNTLKNNNPNQKELLELFQIIKNQAKKDNICTHPNDTLSVSHSIFCIMTLGAICGLKPNQIINIIKLLLKDNYFDNKEIIDIKLMIMEELNNYEKNKSLSQFEYGFQYFTSKDKSINTHMGFYYHAFRLTLYYLYYFDEIKNEKNFSKYRTIMNQICSFGGDTDTNAAIVGTVIGPLIGYKYFGKDDLNKMIKLIPNKRFIFSPALMIIYVYFIKDDKYNNGKFNYNFLKMILSFLFDKIDINNLINIFNI